MSGEGFLRLIARIAAFSLLSGIVLALTTDLILAKIGSNATFLPAPFRFKALPVLSLQELGSGNETEAITTARLAVLRQPLSVEALEALTRSSFSSKPKMSTEALGYAAALGWRSIAVQVAVARSAALARRWSVAAPRLLALTKLNSLDAIDESVFRAADVREYAPQIAPTFAYDGLAWFSFAKWFRDTQPESASKYLLLQTPFNLDENGCNQMGLLARDFVNDGEIEFAGELIDSRCLSHLTRFTSNLTIDQHFGKVQRGPFEWQMTLHSGVSFRTAHVNGKDVVELINQDPLPRRIATKLIRNDNLDDAGKIWFQEENFGRSGPRLLQLSYECILLEGGYENVSKNSPSSFKNNCSFFRVSFQIPSGRYRVWTE